MEPLQISLRHIVKGFDRPVLKDINLEITSGGFISVMGESGCGKSTLTSIVGLIMDFDAGEYLFCGHKISNQKDYYRFRQRQIGFVYQKYNLIPSLTAYENIMLPAIYSSKQLKVQRAEELFFTLNIESILSHKVNTLSGGEKQRVAIARALLLDPALIIADEPTGNLDLRNEKIITDFLIKENESGRAILLITHSKELAKVAKQKYLLSEGLLHEVL